MPAPQDVAAAEGTAVGAAVGSGVVAPASACGKLVSVDITRRSEAHSITLLRPRVSTEPRISRRRGAAKGMLLYTINNNKRIRSARRKERKR
jgi:hypothetical protein